MQLPLYRRITSEDLSDAPKGSWKEKLLYALNLFMQQLYTGLSNQLTPEQNCIAQTKTFSFIGNSIPAKNAYSFTSNFSYNPLGMDLLAVQPQDGSTPVFAAAPFVSWSYLNGTLNILGICGLTDGVPYTVTVRFWWPAITNQG